MDEAKQTPSASGAAKVLSLSFLVGGLFSVVGQVFMVLGKAMDSSRLAIEDSRVAGKTK